MPFKIVRNDITKMNTEAIVNTANDYAAIGSGCGYAVYMREDCDGLWKYREEKIGFVPKAGKAKIRFCYRKGLRIAKENNIKSIAFPIISTGRSGYSKEEGMRIAVDEINAFLSGHDMDIYLVVSDAGIVRFGKKIYPDLETYIDRNYVKDKCKEEYKDICFGSVTPADSDYETYLPGAGPDERQLKRRAESHISMPSVGAAPKSSRPSFAAPVFKKPSKAAEQRVKKEPEECNESFDFEELHVRRLEERMRHRSDTFSQYLMYLIRDKNMENAEVWKRAIVDRKIFSKIKNNPDYHPQKITALCLCVGAKLNLDESKDLLARAGYALSPCDKTDIIFSYFIENEIYDMIELDIQLEEHGLPCIIS